MCTFHTFMDCKSFFCSKKPSNLADSGAFIAIYVCCRSV